MQENLFNDRDVSWLYFNERILQEAEDEAVPLYDRLKFLAIFSSNLDEFFRVRVATIKKLSRLNKQKVNRQFLLPPKQKLSLIHEIVYQHQERFGNLLRTELIPALASHKIFLSFNVPHEEESRQQISDYFKNRVMAYLQPVIMTAPNSRTPYLENGDLYFAVELIDKNNQRQYAHINIPTNHLPRFFYLKSKIEEHTYLFLDDIVRQCLPVIFKNYQVAGCYSIKLNRDAELNIVDEFSGDLVEKIKKHLGNRKIGLPARFLYDAQMPAQLLEFLQQKFNLNADDMIPGGRYHNLHQLMQLPNPVKNDLAQPALESISKRSPELQESILDALLHRDYLFHFPYHSYDHVIRLFNEAALDPEVTEINATFYRVASDSLILNALISAARNGKKVKVFVEVKARFDEENNLRWAAKMEEAGIRIVYSMPGLKVHAKVALIKKETEAGKSYYAYFGTGNFNEKTARIYADHGLLTSDKKLCKELQQVFLHLYKNKAIGKLKHLMVSQVNMKEKLLKLIDREIQIARMGKKAEVIIKLNNLEEPVMIEKLYEASMAGVRIKCLVRGICCLRPGVAPFSENIEVYRLVDNFLEHARIFVFNNQNKQEVFLSSADWMSRNLHRRVEVGFPINDGLLKTELLKLLELQIKDNCKLRKLTADGQNQKVQSKGKTLRAQLEFYHWLQKKEAAVVRARVKAV